MIKIGVTLEVNIEPSVVAVPKPGWKAVEPGEFLGVGGQSRWLVKTLLTQGSGMGVIRREPRPQNTSGEVFLKALEDLLDEVPGGARKTDGLGQAGARGATRKAVLDRQDACLPYGHAMASAASLAAYGAFQARADVSDAAAEVVADGSAALQDASRVPELSRCAPDTGPANVGRRPGMTPRVGQTSEALGFKGGEAGPGWAETSAVAGLRQRRLSPGEAASAVKPVAQPADMSQTSVQKMDAGATGAWEGCEGLDSTGLANLSAVDAGPDATNHSELQPANKGQAAAGDGELWAAELQTVAVELIQGSTACTQDVGVTRTAAPEARQNVAGSSQAGVSTAGTASDNVNRSELRAADVQATAGGRGKPWMIDARTGVEKRSHPWTSHARTVVAGESEPLAVSAATSSASRGHPWVVSQVQIGAANQSQPLTAQAHSVGASRRQVLMVQAEAVGFDQTRQSTVGATAADAGRSEPRAASTLPGSEIPAEARQSGRDRSARRAGGAAPGCEVLRQVLLRTGKAGSSEADRPYLTPPVSSETARSTQAAQQGPREFQTFRTLSLEDILAELRGAQSHTSAEPWQVAPDRGLETSEGLFRGRVGRTAEPADLNGELVARREDMEAADTGFAGPGLHQTPEDTVPRLEKAIELRFLDSRGTGNTTSFEVIPQTQAREVQPVAPSESAKSLPSAVQLESISDQIVRKASMELGPRGGKVTVSLVPEHLGRVELEVTLRDGRLTASLRATNPEVRHELENDIRTLRESLQNLGLDVAEIRVSNAWEPAGTGTGSAGFGREFGVGGQAGTGGWSFGGQRGFDEDARCSWQFDLSFAGGGQYRGNGHPGNAYDAIWATGQGFAGQPQYQRTAALGRAAAQGAAALAGPGPTICRIDVMV